MDIISEIRKQRNELLTDELKNTIVSILKNKLVKTRKVLIACIDDDSCKRAVKSSNAYSWWHGCNGVLFWRDNWNDGFDLHKDYIPAVSDFLRSVGFCVSTHYNCLGCYTGIDVSIA